MPHYDLPSDYAPFEAKVAPVALRNTTDLIFTALDDEYREYDYVRGDTMFTLRVPSPRFINVNTTHGAHRLLDADGVVHYMPGNFVALRWKVNAGTPHFHTTVMQADGTARQTIFPAA